MVTTSGGGPAPPKPWEKRQSAAAQAGISPQVVENSRAFLPSSTGATHGASTLAPLPQYGTPGYGTTGGGGHGGTGYGTGLGASYGTGYGGIGGHGGLSPYGGGIGGYSSGYGGYGGGYGGYNGMPRMGVGGTMGMDPNNGSLGWLNSFNQIVSSIGQITELLGMNAEALNFCIGSFVHFLERIGAMCAGIAAMLAPRPVFPPGHPRHGEPPVTEEEEKSRRRRVRIFQCMMSMGVLALCYKGLRPWLTRLRTRTRPEVQVAPPTVGMGRDLERIFQRTVGVKHL